MTTTPVSPRRVVRARPGGDRTFTVDDFADLTDVPVVSVGWVAGWMEATFLTAIPDEVATAVGRRIVSVTPEEEQLRASLEARLTTPHEDDLLGWLVDVTRLALCIGTSKSPGPSPS